MQTVGYDWPIATKIRLSRLILEKNPQVLNSTEIHQLISKMKYGNTKK
jgi:hypothetical protein